MNSTFDCASGGKSVWNLAGGSLSRCDAVCVSVSVCVTVCVCVCAALAGSYPGAETEQEEKNNRTFAPEI